MLLKAAALRQLDCLRAARLAVAAAAVAAAARGWRVRATLRRLGAAHASPAALRTALLRPSARLGAKSDGREGAPAARAPRPPPAPPSGASTNSSPRHSVGGSPREGPSPREASPREASPRVPLRAGAPVFPPGAEGGAAAAAAAGGRAVAAAAAAAGRAAHRRCRGRRPRG